MRARNPGRFQAGLLIILAVLLSLAGCDTGTGGPIEPALLSVEQVGGVDGTADTTALLLTFNTDPGPLSADDIAIEGAYGGEMSGTGNTRELGLSSILCDNGDLLAVWLLDTVSDRISGGTFFPVVYREL